MKKQTLLLCMALITMPITGDENTVIDGGFLFEFISAKATGNVPTSMEYKNFTLYFYLDKEIIPKITLKHLETGLNLIPEKKWTTGLNVYSWDSEMEKYPGLPPEKIMTLIQLPRENLWEDFSLIPGIITYDNNFPKTIQGYQFIFLSNQKTETELSIYDENENLVKTFIPLITPRAKEILFNWTGDLPSPGVYYLVVNVSGFKEDRKTEEFFSYKFYHLKGWVK